MPPSPKLLVIGGALIDRRGGTDAQFMPGVSNPGTMREEVGGAAFNSARASRQMGVDVTMMSARGGDLAGQSVAAAIAAAGMVDMSSIHLDRATPSYTAILDQEGELRAALADMALFDSAFERLARRASTRDAMAKADSLLIDANLPSTAMAVLLKKVDAKPVFANAISPAKVKRLIPLLDLIDCLFMNVNEAKALTGDPSSNAVELVAGLRDLGLNSGAITNGPDDIVFFRGTEAWRLQPPSIKVADVTGAGDALAGTMIAGLMQGLPAVESLRRGVAAAAFVASSAEVSPKISHDSFTEMLEKVPKPQPI